MGIAVLLHISVTQRQYAHPLASTVVQANLALLSSLSPAHLLDVLGVVGVLLILFAETGLLIGFFLPGDSLLFVAGYATVAGSLKPLGIEQTLPLGWLLVAAAAGAIIGAQVGYIIGLRAGARLFRRPNSRLFKHEYVERAELVLNRFGTGRAVVIARFVPIVRTFMNPLAGAIRMRVRDFTVWNIVGGVLWVTGLVLLGHFIGNVEVIRKHIELFTLLVIAISVAPLLFHTAQETRRARSGRAAS